MELMLTLASLHVLLVKLDGLAQHHLDLIEFIAKKDSLLDFKNLVSLVQLE
jgi:hypothetical protein